MIDEINIRQAVFRGMHECIQQVIDSLHISAEDRPKTFLLIDGNDFIPFDIHIPYTTIEGGDNLYTCIAAASILAKVSRDDYIEELCANHPLLIKLYGIDKNKGYGTSEHMRGIREHGITKWHRTSYGPCKNADIIY